MNKLSITLGGIVLGAALALGVQAADEAPAVKGTWSLNNWTPGDAAHLTLTYRKGSNSWVWGSDQPIADLDGLTRDQLRAAHTSLSFTMSRDAGKFTFDGTLMLGLGKGEYRFVPDPSYAIKLGALGFGPVDGDPVSMMQMAARDLSIAYASEVARSGLKDLAVSDLVRLLDHGVSLEFIRALADVGYDNVTADDVVRFRDHGIDEAFFRGLKAAGAPRLDADDIIRLHDHGVGPDYIARIQSAGYSDLTVDQIIRLHDHGVN